MILKSKVGKNIKLDALSREKKQGMKLGEGDRLYFPI